MAMMATQTESYGRLPLPGQIRERAQSYSAVIAIRKLMKLEA